MLDFEFSPMVYRDNIWFKLLSKYLWNQLYTGKFCVMDKIMLLSYFCFIQYLSQCNFILVIAGCGPETLFRWLFCYVQVKALTLTLDFIQSFEFLCSYSNVFNVMVHHSWVNVEEALLVCSSHTEEITYNVHDYDTDHNHLNCFFFKFFFFTTRQLF